MDPDILEEMFRALDEAKQKELILPFAQYCAMKLLESDNPNDFNLDCFCDYPVMMRQDDTFVIKGLPFLRPVRGTAYFKNDLNGAFVTLGKKFGEKASVFFFQSLLSSLKQSLNTAKDQDAIKICCDELEKFLRSKNIPNPRLPKPAATENVNTPKRGTFGRILRAAWPWSK